MSRNVSKEHKLALYEAILRLQSLDECLDFFEDICAMTELQALEQRFEVARMLKNDKVYLEITQATNASSATISRVNRVLNDGTGCLGRIIDRLEENK